MRCLVAAGPSATAKIEPTVLVTGGAKGVGLIISQALSAAGWKVSACGRSAAASPELCALQRFDTYVHTDLSHMTSAKNLLWRIGPLPDALVCNAGNYGPLGPFVGTDLREWAASFNLNFFSIAQLIHEYLRLA